MKGKMRVYYDEEGDFLEISVGEPSNCTATEVEPGLFLRVDDRTKEVKSVGILDFKKRAKPGKHEIHLPIEINFSSAAV